MQGNPQSVSDVSNITLLFQQDGEEWKLLPPRCCPVLTLSPPVYSFSLNLPVELFSPIAWLSLTLTGLPTPPLRAWQWTKLWTTLLWPTQAPTKWSPCHRTPSPSLETRALTTMASLATSGHSAQAAKGRWWRCRYENAHVSSHSGGRKVLSWGHPLKVYFCSILVNKVSFVHLDFFKKKISKLFQKVLGPLTSTLSENLSY